MHNATPSTYAGRITVKELPDFANSIRCYRYPNLSTDDVQANIWLLAHKDKFLYHLRDTGEVDHALLQNFVASLVHAYQQNAYHADRAWRMTTSELVKAHADWLDAVQGVLNLPDALLAPLDAVRHRDA